MCILGKTIHHYQYDRIPLTLRLPFNKVHGQVLPHLLRNRKRAQETRCFAILMFCLLASGALLDKDSTCSLRFFQKNSLLTL
jgi:hypothetical protein